MGRGHSLKNVDAIILDHNMVEGVAKDHGCNLGNVIPGIVQVCIIFVIKTYRVLVCQAQMKIELIANGILILLSSFCQPDSILL